MIECDFQLSDLLSLAVKILKQPVPGIMHIARIIKIMQGDTQLIIIIVYHKYPSHKYNCFDKASRDGSAKKVCKQE